MIAPAFLPTSPQSVPESNPLALTPAQNEALIREVDDAVRQAKKAYPNLDFS